MNARTILSSKGQVVIPKDIRDALKLKPGEHFEVFRQGERIVLDPVRPDRPRISYEEFRRRLPKYRGPFVPVEEMTAGIGELFRAWEP